ncbi:Sterol O-acyltransferase 2 (Sterol-ester synthase 2) [Basidiobolus ranarum]|uniref:O-acyltransferase n=1 Tax=Basidiobolus ranarum TaxID=34480 RepID=A0ABR2W7C0_9FUNG
MAELSYLPENHITLEEKKPFSHPILSKERENIKTNNAPTIQSSRTWRFQERPSHFDIPTMSKERDPLLGFFILFWIAMGFFLIQTFATNFKLTGHIASSYLFSVLSKDLGSLFISDMVLIAATFISWAIHKAIVNRWFHREYTGIIIQHIYQTSYLALAISWAYWKNWPWIQTSFFVMHAISNLMKVHSYLCYNGELSVHYDRLKALKKEEAILIEAQKKQDQEVDEEAVLKLKEEIANTRANLKTGNTQYPDNVTVKNFWEYLLFPTLVYELEYPRTKSIRPWYIFEKCLALLGTFMLLYVLVEQQIIPVLKDSVEDTFVLYTVLQLIFPFMLIHLLVFYIIFECICNGFAEISRFADRQFYDDWWNSAIFDEYARKWNRPVHLFLLRHVYLNTIETYKLSKKSATYLTFLLSSCLHELVMVIITRRFRPYLFFLQMFQIPLIWLGRRPIVLRYKWLGIAIFWLGIMSGIPLLSVLYCRQLMKEAMANS